MAIPQGVLTRCGWWLWLILLGTDMMGVPGWAQVDLEYQPRSRNANGSWREGVKPKPVAGPSVELISVLADFQEPASSDHFPQSVKLKFFLEDPHAVYVTVRELDYQTYYWLDKVQPAEPWSPGFQNTFSWPSQPVLQQLTPKVDLYDLGVLVRLDAESPSSLERVAPALLFHQDAPSVVTGYFFTFKTGEDARLFATIRQESTGQEMDSQTFRRKRAGRPFTIHWEAKEADPGPYILTLSGFSLSTNQTLSQEIHFYHQPAVNP